MLTQEQITELLDYNPDTGVFTWRARGREMFKTEQSMKTWNTRFSGKRAGTIVPLPCGYTYRRINMLGKFYREHRLAWVYMTGENPPKIIDHENRDSCDNRWDNIRDGGNGLNDKNRSKLSSNTSGITGVSWHKKDKKWRARVRFGNKEYHLGNYDSKDEAGEVVRKFRKEHGFDEGHGT